MSTTPNPSTSTTRRASGASQEPVQYQTKKGCLSLLIAMLLISVLTVLAILYGNGGAGLHSAG